MFGKEVVRRFIALGIALQNLIQKGVPIIIRPPKGVPCAVVLVPLLPARNNQWGNAMYPEHFRVYRWPAIRPGIVSITLYFCDQIKAVAEIPIGNELCQITNWGEKFNFPDWRVRELYESVQNQQVFDFTEPSANPQPEQREEQKENTT